MDVRHKLMREVSEFAWRLLEGWRRLPGCRVYAVEFVVGRGEVLRPLVDAVFAWQSKGGGIRRRVRSIVRRGKRPSVGSNEWAIAEGGCMALSVVREDRVWAVGSRQLWLCSRAPVAAELAVQFKAFEARCEGVSVLETEAHACMSDGRGEAALASLFRYSEWMLAPLLVATADAAVGRDEVLEATARRGRCVRMVEAFGLVRGGLADGGVRRAA